MASYVVQEADGTSRVALEDGTGFVILEAEPGAVPTDVVLRHELTGLGPDAHAGGASRRWG